MIVKCPISVGELVDKITILEIKNHKIQDEKKLKFIQSEHSKLLKELERLEVIDQIRPYHAKLYDINLKLWEIEDHIRELERQKRFDKEFVELARSVYLTNDKRFSIKHEINLISNSTFQEVKSYKSYK